MRYFIRLLIGFHFILIAHAQTVNRLNVIENNIKIGSIARIAIEFKSEDRPWCGIVVDWGDGRNQPIRIGHDGEEGAPKSPFVLENTYKSAGKFIVKVKGETLIRGFGTAKACAVDVAATEIAVLDPKADRKYISETWARHIASLTKIEARCVELGAVKRGIKYEISSYGELSPMDSQGSLQLLQQCKYFASQKHTQGIATCKIQGALGQVDSLCDSVYVENSNDLSPRVLTLDQVIENHLTGKSWSVAMLENQTARENRTAAENLKAERNKLDEEKERKFKLTPEYKKQQAELEKKRISELKEAAALEAKEKAESAARMKREEAERLIKAKQEAVEMQAKRLAEEKEREVTQRRQKLEAQLVRPLMSLSDPRINCQTAIYMDTRFHQLADKVSLTGLTEVSFAMLADKSQPSIGEKKLIAALADENKKCAIDSNNFRKANYPKQVMEILEREDTLFSEAAMDIYSNKTPFGTYNQRLQQIAKDSRTRLQALETQLQAQKIEQEESAKLRAAAMREAQQRLDQQRQAESRRQDQIRQAEQERIAGVRRQWAARCEFDRRNAFERYKKTKENDCNINSAGLVLLCVIAVQSQAEDYAKSAFDSCMSGAPN